MFNLKEKMKNVGFWISLVSSVLLCLQAFGLKVDAPYVMEIVNSILGVLVILGLISDPDKGSGYIDSEKKKK